MPVNIQCNNLPITFEQVADLWKNTVKYQNFTDDLVTVRCVSDQEIEALNQKYRSIKKPTNVLTFSYGEGEHDIALCLVVAEKEAKEKNINIVDYVGLLLVHAFLHACGLDHELSEAEEVATRSAEKKILEDSGFTATSL